MGTSKLTVLQHQGTIAARARQRPRDRVSQELTLPPLSIGVVSTVLCRLQVLMSMAALRGCTVRATIREEILEGFLRPHGPGESCGVSIQNRW